MFDLSSLGNMTTTLRGIVETVTKYDIDEANKGAFLWLTKPNNGENTNVLGSQIIKVSMPFDMFAHCQAEVLAGRFVFPGVFEVDASVIAGAGNKGGYKALALRQIARLKISADAVGGNSDGKPSQGSKSEAKA